jgi:NAD(P)-dependent dehydrogenase (short-subunit alcohol dehydrogenase family)
VVDVAGDGAAKMAGMEQLSGKVAVVTGGASGIGRAMAERFGAEGMAVVLADIEPASLKATTAALVAAGVDVLAVPTDVTDQGSFDALGQAATDRFGAYHVVCNNAGVAGHFGLTWQTTLEDWRWVFDVNIWGVINGIRSLVPALVAQHEGHVVNTASLAAWSAPPAMGPYAASKHAVLAISESLRAELEALDAGVGVSAVCPGLINTKIMSSERNWPSRLGAEPSIPDDEVTLRMRELLTAGTTSGGIEPTAVADAVVAGIKANQFIVTTNPDQVVSAAESRLAKARQTEA